MTLSPAKIIATICPALAGSPSLPVFVEMAQNYVASYKRGFFGTMGNLALALLACHFFAVFGAETEGGGESAKGPVSSWSEGDVSVSLAATSVSSESFSTTRFGNQFLDLLNTMKKRQITLGVNTGGLPPGVKV
jgi:hypothetical protein